MSRRNRSTQAALKKVYKKNPEGSHRWDIVSRNDALLVSFRYSPLAVTHSDNSVFCRLHVNRMDVINRNKDEAQAMMQNETLPIIFETIQKSKPAAREIVFPYSEFMSDTLSDFCKRKEYLLERRVHRSLDNSDKFHLAVQLTPKPTI